MAALHALLLFATCTAHGQSLRADQHMLRDHPIASESVVYLDGNDWVATSPGAGSGTISIPASVPGDIISDLYRAGRIGNPYFELNWLNSSEVIE